MIELVRGKAWLFADGSYEGSLEGIESVKLAADGMTVDLQQIENVRGSAGDDTVRLGGTLATSPATINLGSGQDALHLVGTDTYGLTLKGVETVTGDAGAVLMLQRQATFETDGTVSIIADRRPQDITFTDIADNITVSLGGGRDRVTFGAGFRFSTNSDGDLVVLRNGNVLTLEGSGSNSGSLTIVVDGHRYSYSELLGSGLVDSSAPSVLDVVATRALLTDVDAGPAALVLTVTFDEAMQADGSADPVFSFTPGVASTLTFSSGSWNAGGTAYSAVYAVVDAGVDVDSVAVGVSGAKDLVGLSQASYVAQIEFGIDTLNPTVTAFTTDNSDGAVSDADSVVTYSVTFSEAVASLAASDLQITGGTLTAGPVLAGDGLSATFSVTATDDSTANLVVALKNSVVDANGNALLVLPSPLSLTVDRTNPTVTAFTEDNSDGVVSDADGVVTYSVTFSEAVASLAASDLQVTGGTLTAGPVLAGDGLSATFSVTATDDSTADLVVALKNSVVDANGNALVTPTPLSLTVDTVNPTITSIERLSPTDLFTNADSLVYRVTFSESVSGVDISDFSWSGVLPYSVSFSPVSGSVFDIGFDGGNLPNLNGDVTLSLIATPSITDSAGNALSNTTPITINDSTYKVDNTAPTVNLSWIGVSPWGYRFGLGDPSDNMATVNGENSDSYRVTASQIDWSKLWIELDGSGTKDITFTAADIAWVDPTQGSFWFALQASKIAEINAAVDGGDDLIVVDEGFWVDLAGNVQLVGGNYSTTAVDIL